MVKQLLTPRLLLVSVPEISFFLMCNIVLKADVPITKQSDGKTASDPKTTSG